MSAAVPLAQDSGGLRDRRHRLNNHNLNRRFSRHRRLNSSRSNHSHNSCK